ncbi:hypothetical protein NLG97_g4845 [Lecanicillium saksenae]|uniref:Uncharacterized protein n=1 Tax=Lecanicillium saksenae TaxID=468837 RepID=A0ACC1QU53_9HYPO|nr:hypothetical protein NLG97_g4845 [Lecanicillium saksenae]
MDHLAFSPELTRPDALVLRNLAAALVASSTEKQIPNLETGTSDEETLTALQAMNDPKDPGFEPTVFSSMGVHELRLPPFLDRWVLRPYINMARVIARVDTDVVMITHLLLYFATSVPSAAFLIYTCGEFSNNGFWLADVIFPYITDPLMGHTWNSYYYHHVKHHHVEGNGPNDLSSTIRYQRDSALHFLHYTARFFFFIWLDLPLYFVRKRRLSLAAKAAFWEIGYYAVLYKLYRFNSHASIVVFILPLLLLRAGLMLGNWGQHAFVDHDEPDSDYRSSITLIDVPSNRYCFKDGYHTSHHLNPRRHWREHPISFIKDKSLYASQNALAFHNIDYLMITARLLMKDYVTLAKCMIPIGDQAHMTL